MSGTVQIQDRWHRRTPASEGEKSCRCGTTGYPYASGAHGAKLRWAVRWREAGGTQRKKMFQTKPEANTYASEVKSSMDGGSYVKPTEITFGEVAARWRAATSVEHRPQTRGNVERTLRLHILPQLGPRKIVSIKKADVQEWVNDRAEVLAASSVEVVYGTLKAVFSWAVGEYIAVNPCRSRGRADRIRLPAKPTKEIIPLSTAQVSALVEAAPDGYWVAVLLSAASGLRQGELFGLEPEHVLDGEIVVRQQLSVIDGKGVHIAPVKTATSLRGIPVPTAVTDAVRARIKAHPPVPQLMADTTSGRRRERLVRPVFTTPSGEPVQRSPWARVWAKIVKRANEILAARGEQPLPAKATLHTLRHTYASLLIKEGESVKVVQKRLGHSSAAITLDTYSHLWPDSAATTRRAVERGLGGLLGGRPGHSSGHTPSETVESQRKPAEEITRSPSVI
ncbi:site-specific integrase [Streptomyces sp. NPDC004959]|uniref:tyrosine-type recombinase/integrase n=1 Tax=Streptomyces sp. NPDC004959 TaxID=3154673 RepID=UPI0033B2E1C5